MALPHSFHIHKRVLWYFKIRLKFNVANKQMQQSLQSYSEIPVLDALCETAFFKKYFLVSDFLNLLLLN